MTETIGIIGVGRMGTPICARLAQAGFDVAACDERADAALDVRAAGARWIADSRRLAGEAEVLITVLPGADELRGAMASVTPALRRGAAWIDLTSSAPAVGLELMGIANERGVECLDAPVGGGPAAARAGGLQLFVGGTRETIDRHRPVLETIGEIEHVGDQGAGYTAKLLVNLLWFGQAVAAGEALLLAQRAGIGPDVMRSVIGRSAARSGFADRDLDALLDGDYLATFGLDRCCQELEAVVSMAEELSVPFELSALVKDTYLRALQRYGPRDGELLAVALLEEQAGLRLRR